MIISRQGYFCTKCKEICQKDVDFYFCACGRENVYGKNEMPKKWKPAHIQITISDFNVEMTP